MLEKGLVAEPEERATQDRHTDRLIGGGGKAGQERGKGHDLGPVIEPLTPDDLIGQVLLAQGFFPKFLVLVRKIPEKNRDIPRPYLADLMSDGVRQGPAALKDLFFQKGRDPFGFLLAEIAFSAGGVLRHGNAEAPKDGQGSLGFSLLPVRA